MVESLYEQVVARHPLGIPYGSDMDVFAPYLSKALLHSFDLSNACFADWRRKYPDPNLKPSIGMFEDGIFSGDSEKTVPMAFHVEKITPGRGGSSRVYVRLAWDSPQNKPWIWYVAVVVIHERGRPVVNDVLYLKNRNGDIESTLTQRLSWRCKGGRYSG